MKLKKNLEKLKKGIFFDSLQTKKHFRLCLAPIETPHCETYL